MKCLVLVFDIRFWRIVCVCETYSAFGVNITVTMSFFKLTVFESGSVSIDSLVGKRVSYLGPLERSIFNCSSHCALYQY